MPNKSVYLYQEARANFFNMMLMLVMAFLGGIALILNEVEIFTAEKEMFRYAILELVTYAAIPFLIYLIHDKIRKCKKHDTILEKPFFKIIIIIFIFFCIVDLCVSWSFQGTLLMAIPPIVAAQYKNERK